METCILTIIKNEHQYLDEFIKYHINLGIGHIFIAEDMDSNSHKEITDKYSSEKVSLLNVLDFFTTQEEKDKVVYEKTHFYKMQFNYLRHGLSYIKSLNKYDWCFAIDCDEYITLENDNQALNEILDQFKFYDVIYLQWQNYGANGLIYKPNYKKKNITETYTRIADFDKQDKPEQNGKCVYNMQKYIKDFFKTNHLPSKKAKWCKTDFSQDSQKITYDKIYLRHYVTKSWEEYIWKLNVRGMFFKQHRTYDTFFDINKDMEPRKKELIRLIPRITRKYTKKQTYSNHHQCMSWV